MVLADLLHELVVPPGPLWILALSGVLAIARERHRLGHLCVASSLIGLWLCSSPWVVSPLARLTQSAPAVARDPSIQLVVVLGSGTRENARHRIEVDATGYNRVQEGVWQARLLHVPLLLSDGTRHTRFTGAQLMARASWANWDTLPTVLEECSQNTQENASFTALYLHRHHIHRILLVTSALHLPRAQADFEREGIDVVGDGVESVPAWSWTWAGVVPNSTTFLLSREMVHEWAGLLVRVLQRAAERVGLTAGQTPVNPPTILKKTCIREVRNGIYFDTLSP